MIPKKKRSFFERLTGSIRAAEDHEEEEVESKESRKTGWMEEESSDAELAVDVYQTDDEIIVETMVAGVKSEDIELTVARSMITIRGKRMDNRTIDEENYFIKELYWGGFSRTISLPQEVQPEEAEATEK